MPFREVKPVLNPEVRTLCAKPYPGHPKGCPNWAKKKGCPPGSPMINEVLDLDFPVWAVWTTFDLAAHVERMKSLHPDWSDRQLRCCLYWQPKARKNLKKEIAWFLNLTSKWKFDLRGKAMISATPEAQGVDLTATMASVGIKLEWPPVSTTYQIVLAGSHYEGGR